jgi:hypothetical protein
VAVSNDNSGNILVIGEDAKPGKDIYSKYKTVVALPVSEWMPEGVEAKEIKIQHLDNPHFWNTSFYQMRMLKSKFPAPDRFGENVPLIFRGLVDNDVYFFESPKLKSYSLKPGAEGLKIDWKSRHSTMLVAKKENAEIILTSVNPRTLTYGECKRKAWRVWSVVFANLGVKNKFDLKWKIPALDISEGDWEFLTDPDGQGVKTGFQNGDFGGRKPRSIKLGQIWEEQGVNEVNPNIKSAPDSAYDGFGWYFRKFKMPENSKGKTLYFEVNGIRDIATYSRTLQQTTLWLNGRKMPEPIGVYNAHKGGRGGRLWKLPQGAIKAGEENFIAIQIFNNRGAGGIHRKPARFEINGQNQGMLLPYQFIESKYNPYFFWCW